MSDHVITDEVFEEFSDSLKDLAAKVPARMDRMEADHKALAAKTDSELLKLKQRAARIPGSGAPDPEGSAAPPLLQQQKELNAWLEAPRGRKSALSLELPFRNPKLTTKAAVMNAGGTVHSPGIEGPNMPGLRLAMLLPEVPLALGAGVEYSQETSYVPGAAVVAEGTIKPSTDLVFTLKNAAIKTIATVTKVSVQSLSDVPDLRQWIDQRLAYAVMLKSEDVYLNAATDGLLAMATALTADYTPPAGSTGVDFIAGGVSQLEAGGYAPDAVVVSGPDAFTMRLLKTVDGQYIVAGPGKPVGVRTLWSVPLIVSPSMAKGTFLVAALQQATILFSRQRLTVEISFENEDDFVRNMATIRAEERNVLAVAAPAGLVKGTMPATPPAALAAQSNGPKK